MKKSGLDPKVKKTLVRNCEKIVRHSKSSNVVHDVNASSSKIKSKGQEHTVTGKENFSSPSLCSSEALANYMTDLKKALPPLSSDDLNINKKTEVTKMTRKLNFHMNDKLYKNLVELNSTIEETKQRKTRIPISSTSTKRDLEPNIEDFCVEEKEDDISPKIPVFSPKFKPIRPIESGNLHKLVTSFEVL